LASASGRYTVWKGSAVFMRGSGLPIIAHPKHAAALPFRSSFSASRSRLTVAPEAAGSNPSTHRCSTRVRGARPSLCRVA
jgi:hypothetical protein